VLRKVLREADKTSLLPLESLVPFLGFPDLSAVQDSEDASTASFRYQQQPLRSYFDPMSHNAPESGLEVHEEGLEVYGEGLEVHGAGLEVHAPATVRSRSFHYIENGKLSSPEIRPIRSWIVLLAIAILPALIVGGVIGGSLGNELSLCHSSSSKATSCASSR